MLRLLSVLLAAGLTTVAAKAQAQSEPSSLARRTFSRLGNLFGGDLPELDRPNVFKLTFRPHFGDLHRRDYLRLETGLRWALSGHFELRSDASVFVTHGLKDSAGYGIGRIRGGARYIFSDLPWRDYETSLDLQVETPVGRPPVDMTDGFAHIRPSFIVQHRVERNPRLTLYGGLGLDLIDKTSIPGTPGFNQPHDNSLALTAGGVYDAGQLKWTFAATYATTALIGERSNQFVYLQPGLLWYVPHRFTFNSKSQFILGLGARTTWGPDGTDFGLSSRLRVELTLRQFMDGIWRRSGKSPD